MRAAAQSRETPLGSLGGTGDHSPKTARWWATGLALVPLFVLITVFGYVLVASVGGALASPFIDLTASSEDPFLTGTLGLAAFGLLIGVPPALLVCAVYLGVLQLMAHKGWHERRLRRAAIIGGVLLTAPFVVLVPVGALFGVIVPLPGADARTRRRALAKASAFAVCLFVLLLPVSLIVPD